MNQIILAVLVFITLSVTEAAAKGLVNTEAGTFRCFGSIVRLDRHGIPLSGEPGGEMRPCNLIVEIKESI
jgi:hypothetical protein